jgi:hypothetical protein
MRSKHPAVRAGLDWAGCEKGLEIHHDGEPAGAPRAGIHFVIHTRPDPCVSRPSRKSQFKGRAGQECSSCGLNGRVGDPAALKNAVRYPRLSKENAPVVLQFAKGVGDVL